MLLGGFCQPSAVKPYHRRLTSCDPLSLRRRARDHFRNIRPLHKIQDPKDGKPQSISVPKKELYLGEVEDMHAAILDGATPYLSLEETRNHVHTALALYKSARSGQVVEL